MWPRCEGAPCLAERERAWDGEKGPPGMPGPTHRSEQGQSDQGARGFAQVWFKYLHKRRNQTSVSPAPGADHPRGEGLVLISRSPSPLGLILSLCTPSVPCSSPLPPPVIGHFCRLHLTSLAARGCGKPRRGHGKGHGRMESIPCSANNEPWTRWPGSGWEAGGQV